MKYLEAVPKNWKRTLILPAVSKDGTVYEDAFLIEEKTPVSYWGQLYEFLSPLEVKIKAYRTETNLCADITVSGKAGTPCARCLEPAKADFSGTLKYLFSLYADAEPQKKDEKNSSADGDEDVIFLDSWEDEIDLSPQIWEVMLTSLPAVVLCREDCKGLCPECGANLNTEICGCKKSSGDARFEVLRQFVEEEKE